MEVTARTTVKEALESSKEAVLIFMRHGVNPMDKCAAEYDRLTIEEAEERCNLNDIEELIKELNDTLKS